MKARGYDHLSSDEVLSALRQEILAARLKVTLDEELGRETSDVIIELSKMNAPSIRKKIHSNRKVSEHHCSCGKPCK